jgi:peroxiredoxin
LYQHERSFVDKMKGKPFALIGINSDEPEDALKAVEKNELNWRSFRNEREGVSSISEDWDVAGWPTLVVLDSKGIIAYRGHDGHRATAVAAKLVAKLENGEAEEEPEDIGTAVGQIAPDISGVDLDGVSFNLYDYKGKVLMLDFWGDW